jgi:hypothetical protein
MVTVYYLKLPQCQPIRYGIACGMLASSGIQSKNVLGL